jgi:hypothetical protein
MGRFIAKPVFRGGALFLLGYHHHYDIDYIELIGYHPAMGSEIAAR